MIETEKSVVELSDPNAKAFPVGFIRSALKTGNILADGGVRIQTPNFSFLFLLVPSDTSESYKLKTYVKPKGALVAHREIEIPSEIQDAAWLKFFNSRKTS